MGTKKVHSDRVIAGVLQGASDRGWLTAVTEIRSATFAIFGLVFCMLSFGFASALAAAGAEREFALVELGGLTLAIPKEWIVNPSKRWGAGINSQPRRKGILLDALNSNEPIRISRLRTCCREDRLEPLFPHRAPFFVGLTAGDAPQGSQSVNQIWETELRDLKTNSKPIFPGFWKLNTNSYLYEPKNRSLETGGIRKIWCIDDNIYPIGRDIFGCNVNFNWRTKIGIKYMFNRDRFPLKDFHKLDETVTKLLNQLELWAGESPT